VQNPSSIVFSGIVPHPPIMVPEVGHDSIVEVQSSIAAMAELTHRLITSGAETVVMISPHAPLDPRAFVAYSDSQLHGDFGNFRAPEITLTATLDTELLAAIAQEAAAEDFEVLKLAARTLDHGIAVPLYFLRRNGWQGRVVALGYSFLGNEDHLRFGASLATAVEELGRPTAIIASGDLSHRLKPGAPAGHNPSACLFDEEVVAALQANSPERIINIDHNLRRTAGECGYRSMLIAIGATRELAPACEVLHYEAPFGVGYLVAQITNQSGDQPDPVFTTELIDRNELPALARNAVETFVLTGRQIKPPRNLSALLTARAACFVTIRTGDDELRGCIGTIEPVRDSLAEELIINAISSATRDPRFRPVSAGELPQLRYSVDVLAAPEPATLDQLDPIIYGVVVAEPGGERRGLLLPNIEGVATASQQVEIATRKAGIPAGTPVELSRFSVQRFSES
jgi:MEMO1 family protein